MDVLKDEFFEEKQTVSRPFPEEDYDKNGKLRKVRGRVLKKLLKYESKAYVKPMLIVMIALFAVALVLCVLGSFVTAEDFSEEADHTRMISWTISLVLFVYLVLFAMLFPVGIAAKRYHKQFFTSEAYLTLSIPASPEEHILAKRIAGYVAMAVASVLSLIAIIIVVLPLGNLLSGLFDPSVPSEPIEPTTGVNAFDVIYILLEILISPLMFLSVCGGFCCWRHRGLKNWMIVLIVASIYLLSAILGVAFAGMMLSLPEEVILFFAKAGKWILLAVELAALYFLFRYETQTLRKKINLK